MPQTAEEVADGAEHTDVHDEVTVTVRIAIPNGDTAARQGYAEEIARQYQAAVWDVAPVSTAYHVETDGQDAQTGAIVTARLRAVEVELPDWQPLRVYQQVTVMPRTRLAEVGDRGQGFPE